MRLHDGEPIGQAIRRFKKLLQQLRPFGKPYKATAWWCAPPHFVRNTEIRRYKAWRKKYKARRAAMLTK
jgi:hypothetical protein